MLPCLFLINGGYKMSRNKPIPTLNPKQYRLKHRSKLFTEEGYLHKFVETGTYFLENEFGCDLYQTAFTVEEIGEMVKEFDILFYFEMEEITDYD